MLFVLCIMFYLLTACCVFVLYIYRDLKEWNASIHHSLRTTYRRTVFQEHNGSEVRMSFDEDIKLTDIKNLTWDEAIDPTIVVPEYKVFHFPLGILEVKLAFEKFEEIDYLEIPDWIIAMQNSGLIIEVEKFSKYCTGAAIMNLNRITRVPSWIAAVKTLMEIELARKGREWFGAEKLPKWVIEANIKVPERVEPREFMANERTLLKWVRMCFLALFVGLSLLSFESIYEPITGILLTIFSLMILFRAYYMYRIRLKMLLARNFDTPFYDPYGPHMIVFLFVVPTITYLAFALGLWNIKV